ncbi:MAG: nuclear transport factor 2 family protein [Pseudomonadota bacterium]
MEKHEMFELAAGLGEAKNRQNVEKALKFLHPEMVLYSPAWGAIARGLDENRQLLTHLFTSYPDYCVSLDGYVADAETFFSWGNVRMTMASHASDAAGMRPNGQRITLPVTIRMRFKEGLIAMEYFSCDLAQVAAQSGISIDGMWKNVFGSSPGVSAA